MGFKGYDARELEDALGQLWQLVENRLTEEDYKKLGINKDSNTISGIFEELHSFGTDDESGRPYGPVGLGLGRCGGHAVGED